MTATQACETGKTRYATSTEADEALQWARERTPRGGLAPTRIYLCLKCAAWHLTSGKFLPHGRRTRKHTHRRKK